MRTIDAYAAKEAGARLEPWQYEQGRLGAHDIRAKVHACGVCHSDLHIIDDDWGVSRYPLVPGHEVVGIVDEVGGEVHHLKPGDKVGIGWQRYSCGHCQQCLSGNQNLCAEYQATIVHGYGGFADMLVVNARFAYPWPKGLDDVKAAPLLCAGQTVYSALRHGGMTTAGSIGVIGVGGLGHLAIQFAAKLGNRVTAITTSEDKADFAAELGAHDSVVSLGPKAPKVPRKFDILLNTAPADLDWPSHLNLLAPDGTLVFVAKPPSNFSVPVGMLLGGRRRVMGSPIGGRPMMVEMLKTADRYGIEPVVETSPMDQVNDVLDRLRENKVRYRAVLTR